VQFREEEEEEAQCTSEYIAGEKKMQSSEMAKAHHQVFCHRIVVVVVEW